MTTFVIDTDNNISAHAEAPASATENTAFATQKELARLTAEWPTTRLVEVWNSFAGAAPFDDLKPVKKFTDRKSAIERIWKAVQRLTPVAAAEAPGVAPEADSATKDASPKTRTPKPPKAAKQAKPKVHTRAQKDAPAARDGSKKAEVLEMMRRKDGATLAEIMKATGWQAHTVRGFMAGTLKKMGIAVESFRSDDKERTYRAAN